MIKGQRISIVGTSSSGKSTLGRKLGERLGLPVYDLDDFYWLPGWEVKSPNQFMVEVEALVAEDSWIIIGNYGTAKLKVWGRADTLVWLDYPLHVCLWRGLKRVLHRGIIKQKICNGNTESLWRSFFTKESILLWIVKTYKRRRTENEAALSGNPELAKKMIVHRLESISQAKGLWL